MVEARGRTRQEGGMTVWSKNGDDYNHDGDSARDGEAEAGEEGAYMAILSSRRPEQKVP